MLFCILFKEYSKSINIICIIRSKILKLLIVVVTSTLVALALVDGGNDGVADTLHFLHLLFVGVLIGVVVRVEPVFGLSDGVLNS